MAEKKPRRERKSLGLTCKKTKCDQNLHCFLPAPKQKHQRQALASPVPEPSSAARDEQSNYPKGCCWNCGVKLVDWERVHRRETADLEYTIACLKVETVRHEYWCKPIDERAWNQAYRRGRTRMAARAVTRVRQSVGAAKPFHDGYQTGPDGDVLYYGQHATATCCRKCMETWHDIPQGRDLTEDEVQYCAEILLRYVDERIPDLPAESQKVPYIRKQREACDEARAAQRLSQ